jgi:hypothetical protein
MSKLHQKTLDKFIDALEEMIDAKDDMWEEEKYSNYRQMNSIKENRYIPAREIVRESLEKIIEEFIIIFQKTP